MHWVADSVWLKIPNVMYLNTNKNAKFLTAPNVPCMIKLFITVELVPNLSATARIDNLILKNNAKLPNKSFYRQVSLKFQI